MCNQKLSWEPFGLMAVIMTYPIAMKTDVFVTAITITKLKCLHNRFQHIYKKFDDHLSRFFVRALMSPVVSNGLL